MNFLLVKGAAGVLAIGAAAGAGYGISSVTRSSSPSVGSIKSKLPDGRRWLESNADAIEWGVKVDKYKS